MSTTQTEALKLALEEMKAGSYECAIDRLEEALSSPTNGEAQPAVALEQEPVAWLHWLHGPVRLFLHKDEAMLELERLNRDYPVDAEHRKMRPLVLGDTTPPKHSAIARSSSATPRKPLTIDQIASIAIDRSKPDGIVAFVRAIEAAHGITASEAEDSARSKT